MRNFFLTLDLEEWYHLDYLKHLEVDRRPLLVSRVTSFLDALDEHDIKMTVFVLGEVARSNPDLVRELASRGHEIAAHGLNHELLWDKTNDQFRAELRCVKHELEDLLGMAVRGFRASCYSISDEKLEVVMECGFQYDTSFIRFAEHPLYGKLTLKDFEPVDDLVYRREGFYEFEVPTLQIFKKNIPISGGGYFRLFPWTFFRLLFSTYSAKHYNFIFYIHPFELTAEPVPLPRELPVLSRFRFSVGRKHNVAKLLRFLRQARADGYRFTTFSTYIDEREKQL